MRLVGTILALSMPIPAAADLYSFDCVFDQFCTRSENCRPTDFRLDYRYDSTTGKAYLIGNNGIAEVGFFGGDPGFSFFELLSSGAMQTTTINLSDRSAVHSRHTIIGLQSSFSQYYGSCRG